MVAKTKTDFVLGVVVVILSAAIMVFWIPIDIETGIFEKVRRRTEIGNSFAPVLAVSILALGGALLVLEALKTPGIVRLERRSILFAVGLLALFAFSTSIMIWAGPLAVEMFAQSETAEYRLLRDTVPWKYIGFVTGGTFLITTLISVVEHRLTFRAFVVGLMATIAILLIYDLPFDDLLIPPNGDV